jgi:hypothetical protein
MSTELGSNGNKTFITTEPISVPRKYRVLFVIVTRSRVALLAF